MSAESEDESQKDVIEVLVQEAQEWLEQSHVALDELQQGPAPDRHVELAHTIKACVANIGGSAATIGLRDVEWASLSAYPFIEAVQNPADKVSIDDFIALCKQLGSIRTALLQATDVTIDAKADPDHAEGMLVTVPTGELLALLHGFRDRGAKTGFFPRNLLATVIAEVEGLTLNGIEQCNVTSIRELLERWSEGEEGFLESVEKHMPAVANEIDRLKSGAAGESPDKLRAIVEQVAQLWSAAQQVNATQAVTFFMGLHSMLTMVMQRRVAVAPDTYAAVQSRLMENVKTLQVWVEAGRVERSAIDGLLPVSTR